MTESSLLHLLGTWKLKMVNNYVCRSVLTETICDAVKASEFSPFIRTEYFTSLELLFAIFIYV